MENPHHVVVRVKQSVVLNCIFNSPVECQWYRKDKHVIMGRYYKFISNEVSHAKQNCSLEISSVQKKDIGAWQCSGFSADKNTTSFSKKASLILEKQSKVFKKVTDSQSPLETQNFDCLIVFHVFKERIRVIQWATRLF